MSYDKHENMWKYLSQKQNNFTIFLNKIWMCTNKICGTGGVAPAKPLVCVYFSLLDEFNQRDYPGTQSLPRTNSGVVLKQWGVSQLGTALMTPSFPTSFGSVCPSAPWAGAVFTASVLNQKSSFTNIQQCLAFEQQDYMFSVHRQDFQGCKKISCSDQIAGHIRVLLKV